MTNYPITWHSIIISTTLARIMKVKIRYQSSPTKISRYTKLSNLDVWWNIKNTKLWLKINSNLCTLTVDLCTSLSTLQDAQLAVINQGEGRRSIKFVKSTTIMSASLSGWWIIHHLIQAGRNFVQLEPTYSSYRSWAHAKFSHISTLILRGVQPRKILKVTVTSRHMVGCWNLTMEETSSAKECPIS
jgi:hypothetical protein